MDYNNYKCSITFEKELETIVTNGGWEKNERIGNFTITILNILNTDFKELLFCDYNKNLKPDLDDILIAFEKIEQEIEKKYGNMITFFLLNSAKEELTNLCEEIETTNTEKLKKHLNRVPNRISTIYNIYGITENIEKKSGLYCLLILFEKTIQDFTTARHLIDIIFNVYEFPDDKTALTNLAKTYLHMPKEHIDVGVDFSNLLKLNFTPKTFLGFIILELNQLVTLNIKIKLCKNCQNYFIPLNRSNELYCNEISPQDKTKSCKEYGKTRTYLDNIKNDESKNYYKKTYNKLRNRVNRHPQNEEYKKQFSDFLNKNAKWKNKIDKNTATEKDYIEWLKLQKGEN